MWLISTIKNKLHMTCCIPRMKCKLLLCKWAVRTWSQVWFWGWSSLTLNPLLLLPSSAILLWAPRCSCHTPVCYRRSFLWNVPNQFGIFSVSINCNYPNITLNMKTLLIIFLKRISPSPNILCKHHLLIIVYSSRFSWMLASFSVSCLLLSSLCSNTEVLGHYLIVFRN